MSHTSTIKSIVIKDLQALRKACAELKRDQGVNLSLESNKVPRAYYKGQDGMSEPAEICITLHDSKYDVGIYKNEDGVYEARCDFWAGQVANVLGADPEQLKQLGDLTREEQAQAQLGKLYQLYATNAAENAIISQGGSCIRSTKADGTVQLIMRAA